MASRIALRARGLLTAVVLLAGCRAEAPAPPPPVDTGAEDAVVEFFDALVRKDWDLAYRRLDADSRARCPKARFVQLAQSHRRGLGFEPDEVTVRSCEEHGEEAVVHVVFTGRADGKGRRRRDGATLRHTPAGWGVVLSPRFGQAAP